MTHNTRNMLSRLKDTIASPKLMMGVAASFLCVACDGHTQNIKKASFKAQTSQTLSNAVEGQQPQEQPVDLTADTIEHDNDSQVITARGNVEIMKDGRILKANEVQYFLKEDRVVAHGKVVLVETTGDVHFADKLVLNDGLKSGFVVGLRSVLADDSRFWAEEGTRVNAKKIVMRNARYTACKPCHENNQDETPAWQINADKVTWDEEEKTIAYNDATFEVAGVPVFYTPYFRHPDGTVKQKSGVLAPKFGFTSILGATVDTAYYFALDESEDATLGAKVATQELPLLFGEYRRRFGQGEVLFDGSITRSSRRDAIGEDTSVEDDNEIRGHIYGEAKYDINDKWRAGAQLALASDEQFLNEYDVDLKTTVSNARDDDVLQNSVYLERFDDRNYTQFRALGFQDLRPVQFDNDEDQPFILPQVETSFIGDPGSFGGGRLEASGSFLSLFRDGKGQDLYRTIGSLGWKRRDITNFGLVTDIDATLRGDIFFTTDRDDATSSGTGGDDDTAFRLFPQIHLTTSYPFVKPMTNTQITFEPIVALTLAGDVDDDDDIPNEDSRDVQIDTTNLFDANRFPGLDQIEDRSRVTYGVKTGVHDYAGNFAEVFFGQSYRFDEDNNPFPNESGLENQESDYVGQIRLALQDMVDLNYRFQLDGQGFEAARHEVTATGTYGPVGLSTRYFYLDEVEGTGFDGAREQINAFAHYDFTENWRLTSFGTYDFSEDVDGLLRAGLGFGYTHECYNISLTAVRNLTDEVSGESDTEIFLRFGLKNLGEFATGGLSVSSSSGDSGDDSID